VFGIVSASPVWRFQGGMDQLEEMTIDYARMILADGRPRTFKIETRRGSKRFALTSPEISAQIGGAVLDAEPERLTVDVHHPDFVIYIEIRDQIYLYSRVVTARKACR
jgi:tRNA uracil 4-sulfurtransferase